MHSNQGYVHDREAEVCHPPQTREDELNIETSPGSARSTDATARNDSTAEVTAKHRLVNIGLFLADQLFAGLVIGPLTVFFWWGAWNFLTRHIYPDAADVSAIICMVTGNCGLVFLGLTQNLWKAFVPVETNWLAWLVGLHGYTALCGFFNVCHWRGVWIILDHYTGISLTSYWITYVIGQMFLWIFKTSKSAQAPPMIVVPDRTSSVFTYAVRFKTEPSVSMTFLYDVLFTVVIINQLVVFYWRGVWGLLDELFFKGEGSTTMWAGFVVGYLLMLLMCFVQPLFNLLFSRAVKKQKEHPIKREKKEAHSIPSIFGSQRSYDCQTTSAVNQVPASSCGTDDKSDVPDESTSSCESTLRWFLEVVLYYMSNLVSVFIWRSVWRFCDAHLLPWNPDAGNAVGVSVGLGTLTMLTCAPSIAIRGCDIEGDESLPPQHVCFNPNFYFRQLYSERTKNTFFLA